jgi:hypothetical protein
MMLVLEAMRKAVALDALRAAGVGRAVANQWRGRLGRWR